MHKLLERQLRRTIGLDSEGWSPVIRAFIEQVDQAYQSHETDRGLLERSLELSSSELTAKNEALVRARDEADSASRSKSSFLANMSHEMRTPLNAIIGYSELLHEEADELSPSELRPELEKIRSAGRHLLGLINDVLDLSKIEAGRMDVTIEAVEVPKLGAEVMTLLTGTAQQKKNRLTFRCDDRLLSARADAGKLRQTLVNLVGNALKFTEQGEVSVVARRSTVSAGVAAGLSAWNELEPETSVVCIEVRDTGIGIAPEMQPRLFSPFTQADAGTSRRFGGTGLGLSLSRRFVQMMGGDVTLHSVLGAGSTFSVWLPCAEPVALPLAPATLLEAERTYANAEDTPTILAIDDDANTLALIDRFLGRLGYRVVGRSSGARCVEDAVELKPACILLDVVMPEVDGWRVLSALQRDPRTAGIPVVMATISNEQSVAFALGAAEFLTKPIDWERLSRIVHRYAHPAERVALVVDDDPDARDLHRRALERRGWRVQECGDGREALARIASSPPDLVLLDLNLPQIDGFGVLSAIRSQPATRNLPVVVVTGRSLEAAEEAELRSQAAPVLHKGEADRDALLREVDRVMRPESTEKPS
jgi:signal transduction histidine kinase/CheY-like chemotaxis protein